jgi:hypothetical protein
LRLWHLLLALALTASLVLLGWSIAVQAGASVTGENALHRPHALTVSQLKHREAVARNRAKWLAEHRRAAELRAAARARAASVLLSEWTRVAVCEEGGWIGYAGPAFPDSLGITAANWDANGGGSDLRPMAQIAVARRLVASLGLGTWVPDQGGCAAW